MHKDVNQYVNHLILIHLEIKHRESFIENEREPQRYPTKETKVDKITVVSKLQRRQLTLHI